MYGGYGIMHKGLPLKNWQSHGPIRECEPSHDELFERRAIIQQMEWNQKTEREYRINRIVIEFPDKKNKSIIGARIFLDKYLGVIGVLKKGLNFCEYPLNRNIIRLFSDKYDPHMQFCISWKERNGYSSYTFVYNVKESIEKESKIEKWIDVLYKLPSGTMGYYFNKKTSTMEYKIKEWQEMSTEWEENRGDNNNLFFVDLFKLEEGVEKTVWIRIKDVNKVINHYKMLW